MNQISKEQLQNALYELYKENWLYFNMPAAEQLEVKREYIRDLLSGDIRPDASFDEYIFENGYHGSCYVCFDEFLEAEYQDRKFIENLLFDGRNPGLDDTSKMIMQAYDEYNEPDLELE
jgi:hypothetical protein